MEFLKKNWFWIFIILIMIFMMINNNDDEALKNKINHLEKLNDSINSSIKLKNTKILTLNKAIDSSKNKIDSLTKVKQKIIKQREFINVQVDNFNNSELDSVINSVPKKQAVKSIINYPLVLDELVLTNKLVSSYKKQIGDLEKRDELRVAIIEDKDKIIENVTKQRDLYEKANKPKTNGFVYVEMPIKNLNRLEGGIDVTVKNKLLVGISGDYNNVTKDIGMNVKLGLKIF